MEDNQFKVQVSLEREERFAAPFHVRMIKPFGNNHILVQCRDSKKLYLLQKDAFQIILTNMRAMQQLERTFTAADLEKLREIEENLTEEYVEIYTHSIQDQKEKDNLKSILRRQRREISFSDDIDDNSALDNKFLDYLSDDVVPEVDLNSFNTAVGLNNMGASLFNWVATEDKSVVAHDDKQIGFWTLNTNNQFVCNGKVPLATPPSAIAAIGDHRILLSYPTPDIKNETLTLEVWDATTQQKISEQAIQQCGIGFFALQTLPQPPGELLVAGISPVRALKTPAEIAASRTARGFTDAVDDLYVCQHRRQRHLVILNMKTGQYDKTTFSTEDLRSLTVSPEGIICVSETNYTNVFLKPVYDGFYKDTMKRLLHPYLLPEIVGVVTEFVGFNANSNKRVDRYTESKKSNHQSHGLFAPRPASAADPEESRASSTPTIKAGNHSSG